MRFLVTKKSCYAWLSCFFIIFGGLSLISYYLLFAPLVKHSQSRQLIVPKGSTITDVAKQLKAQGLYHYPRFLIRFAEVSGFAKRLRFGQYKIDAHTSLYCLLSNMASGRGLVMHKITFIEGHTFAQMKQKLINNPNLINNISDLTNRQIMTLIGHPHQHPEGRFFPDTYLFAWDTTDTEVLRQAYQKMQQLLTQQWQNKATDLPYHSAYQALIAASMIEKETALLPERPKISGVIVRRLKKGMRLQIDPTVLYGLGKPLGTPITKRDLRSNTPYNTYRIHGLPPTPIDMPSVSSIHAALHPAAGNALYYVARGDGSHVFSATYKEHLVAVAQYRLLEKQRRQEIEQLQQLQESHHLGHDLFHVSVFMFDLFLLS